MAHLALAETATSVSEFKKNPMETVVAGEALMDRLEDIELNEMADA